MDFLEHFNDALRYIEENLSEDIHYEKAAKIACCSTYHFQRMFAYMTGVPLSEYIRRRRMSLAAVDLQNGDVKIVDIALKYGYSSPTAFNRAFQSVHGIAPSRVKEGGVSIKAYPPVSFKIVIKGAVEMEYRLETKEAFRIVGIAEPLNNEVEKNFEIVPAMWQKAAMNGTLEMLEGMMDGEPKGVLGISACMEEEKWRYYIAVSSSRPLKEGMEEYLVPASTWAIFPGRGTNLSMQELEKRIVTEWLPSSGYEYANAPDVEVYLKADPEDAIYEVWIPVTKK